MTIYQKRFDLNDAFQLGKLSKTQKATIRGWLGQKLPDTGYLSFGQFAAVAFANDCNDDEDDDLWYTLVDAVWSWIVGYNAWGEKPFIVAIGDERYVACTGLTGFIYLPQPSRPCEDVPPFKVTLSFNVDNIAVEFARVCGKCV